MTSRRTALALLACGLLGGPVAAEPDAEAVEKALEHLERDDRKECRAAVDLLAGVDDDDVRERLAAFGADTEHRELTIRVADVLASGDLAWTAKVLDRLATKRKKHVEPLERVAMMAERLPGKPGFDVLDRLADHPFDRVAAAAVRAFAARGDKESLATLANLVKSSRPVVATAAALSIVRVDESDATVSALLNRVENGKEDRVGDACALALCQLPGAEKAARRTLKLLSGKPRSDAFHGLVKLTLRAAVDPDPAVVAALVKARNRRVVEVGCDIAGLKRVPGAKVQNLLLRVGRGKDWRTRVAAWLALTRTGVDHIRSEIATIISTQSTISSRDNREQSYWAIQCALRHPHEDFVPALRAAALDTKDPMRRALAARALRVAPDKDGTRKYLLEEITRSRPSAHTAHALKALGSLKDEAAFRALVRLLGKAESDKAKLQIVRGLERMTGHLYEPDPDIWMEWFRLVGEVAYDPPKIDRKQNRERLRANAARGISEDTERAVELGLLWLAKHQDASGGWNGATFSDHCVKSECRAEGGHRDREPAYTALSLLAYQGAGYTHLEGPYRDVMRRGFEFLMQHQDYDGSHLEKSWTFSYEAAVVCQALCDGYALTGDEWLAPAAQRSIDYLVKVQHPGRTWRYQVRSSETDSSVMSWILMACISAQTAGLDVPEQIMAASELWLDGAQDPVPKGEWEILVPAQFDPDNNYGIDVSIGPKGPREFRLKTWYQPPQLYTPSMPAIGILCRIWLGWTRAHPVCIGNANTLLDAIPGYGTGLEKVYAFYPYTWYYGSLAMYQMGGKYWSKWRKKTIAGIIEHQHVGGHLKGAWSMPRTQLAGGLTGGRIYCTTMCILTLESFYRYAPYLARASTRGSKAEGEEKGGQPAGDAPK